MVIHPGSCADTGEALPASALEDAGRDVFHEQLVSTRAVGSVFLFVPPMLNDVVVVFAITSVAKVVRVVVCPTAVVVTNGHPLFPWSYEGLRD